MKSPITTHILDTAKGRPAAGVPVLLQIKDASKWSELAAGKTDADGRILEWFDKSKFKSGVYRLTFNTGDYYGESAFFPSVAIEFKVESLSEHYHVPLLLSPYGYSTYRGS